VSRTVALTGRGVGVPGCAKVKHYYVYIMTNRSGTLYTGVTGDLGRRVAEHKAKALLGLTARYGIDRLVYWEDTTDVRAAPAREKQIKSRRRAKKVALVESVDPRWEDLARQWGLPAGHVPGTARRNGNT
jgi:putative endonuclease